MLGLFLIYFIGKAFYDLAFEFNKNQWAYAILGVVSYYAGTFVMGLIIAVMGEFEIAPPVDEINSYLLSFIALPGGLLACYVTYRVLQNSWNKKQESESPADILDADLLNHQP